MKLVSSSGEELAEGNFFVVVKAVNDAPTVVAPAEPITLQEDAALTKISGLYITDPDAHETAGGMIEVSLVLREVMERRSHANVNIHHPCLYLRCQPFQTADDIGDICRMTLAYPTTFPHAHDRCDLQSSHLRPVHYFSASPDSFLRNYLGTTSKALLPSHFPVSSTGQTKFWRVYTSRQLLISTDLSPWL